MGRSNINYGTTMEEEILTGIKEPDKIIKEQMNKDDSSGKTQIEENQVVWRQFMSSGNEGLVKLKDFLSPESMSEFNLMLL